MDTQETETSAGQVLEGSHLFVFPSYSFTVSRRLGTNHDSMPVSVLTCCIIGCSR